MDININRNNTNTFQNIGINNTRKNNHSNDKTDKNNSNITLKQKNKQSSLMENLLNQKQSFIEQKQTLMARDMDSKEKKYKLEEVNKKLQEIESQIQQLTIQEKQEELQKNQDELLKQKSDEKKYTKNDDETRDGVIVSASLNELIKFNSSKETMHLLKDSKNRQKIEAEYIKPNDNPNSYNNRRLSQISKSIANIDMTVSRKVGDLIKSAERIKAKTDLAIEQLKNKEDRKSDEDIETNEDIKEYNKSKKLNFYLNQL